MIGMHIMYSMFAWAWMAVRDRLSTPTWPRCLVQVYDITVTLLVLSIAPFTFPHRTCATSHWQPLWSHQQTNLATHHDRWVCCIYRVHASAHTDTHKYLLHSTITQGVQIRDACIVAQGNASRTQTRSTTSHTSHLDLIYYIFNSSDIDS